MKQWIQPCPYCGNQEHVKAGLIYLTSQKSRVLCIRCFFAGPEKETTEEAIKIWNRIEVHEK